MSISEYREYEKVRSMMLHLGFSIAAENLYSRWREYSERERQIVKERWNV